MVQKLSHYGEIKGQVICLKYKQYHDLAGLENGNRLIRMVLTFPSIPHSLNIGSECCRVIHNNQLIFCSHCDETMKANPVLTANTGRNNVFPYFVNPSETRSYINPLCFRDAETWSSTLCCLRHVSVMFPQRK